MSDTKGKNNNRGFSWKKISIRALSILLALVLIIFLVTQTGLFRSWLKDFAVSKVNAAINGEITIGRLDGNLYGEMLLDDIVLESEMDTLLVISSVSARYSLFGLINGIIMIDELAIDSLFVDLEQLSDSTWNVMRLAKSDTGTASEADTAKGGFDMTVLINNFRLENSSADIDAMNEFIPEKVYDINMRCSGKYEPDKQRLELKKLGLRTQKPDFSIEQLGFVVEKESALIKLTEFNLETANNQLTASATIFPDSIWLSSAEIEADSIDITEFRELHPSMAADLDATANLDLRLRDNTLDADIEIIKKESGILLLANIQEVGSIIDSASQRLVQYKADLSVDDVYMADWLGNGGMDISLSGDIKLQGSGINPESAVLKINGDLGESEFRNIEVSAAKIMADYKAGNVESDISISGGFGAVSLTGNVEDIMGKEIYDFKLEFNKFNLANIGLEEIPETDLHGEITAEGSNLISDSINVQTDIHLSRSTVAGIPIDTAVFLAGYSGNKLDIDTLNLSSPAAAVDLSGGISGDGPGEINFLIRTKEVSYFKKLTDLEDFEINAKILGKATGTFENMSSNASIVATKLSYNDIYIDEFSSDLEVSYKDSIIDVRGSFDANDMEVNGFNIDTIRTEFDYDGRQIDLSLYLTELRGMRCDVNARISQDSLTTILLREFTFEYDDTRLEGGGDSTTVEFDGDTYIINNFELTSGEAIDDSTQWIYVNGIVDLSGRYNLKAEIDNIDLGRAGRLSGIDMGGKISADINMTGKATDPQLESDLAILNGRFRGYGFQRLAGEIDYDSQMVNLSLNLQPTPGESLSIAGTVPMDLSFSDSITAVSSEGMMDLRVYTDSISLEFLKAAGYFVEEVEGFIACDLDIYNGPTNPRIEGGITLRNGKMDIPEYGIAYNGINSDISFAGSRVTIDSLTTYQKSGVLRLSGFLDYDSTLIAGKILASSLNLITDKFYVVRHKSYEVQLSSDVTLGSERFDANYSGSITVNRSSIYLPAIMGETGKETETGAKPMLVVATTPDTVQQSKNTEEDIAPETVPGTMDIEFMKNLRGNLKVNIPRNTWIRSPDMRLELQGQVEVIKAGTYFELFGEISVVRGHYDLYNKRFTVKRGVFTFAGGEENNPKIDIEADYVFRTADREKKTLKLLVAGTAQQPTLDFRLDGEKISEGDAVSYMLFGRPLDALSQGQRSEVSQGSGDGSLPGRVAANLLAGQLSQVLGNQLNLDVIEVKAGGDFQSGAVEVGKYITTDLFISYEHSFGSASDYDLEPEVVTLEYQLTRIIFLQLTGGDAEDAGFDIIFKLEKE